MIINIPEETMPTPDYYKVRTWLEWLCDLNIKEETMPTSDCYKGPFLAGVPV